MAELDVQKFTAAVVSVVVVVIIGITVLVPIINDNQLKDSGDDAVANATSINAMMNIIPLLIFVGVIIAVVSMFLGRNKN